MSFWYKSLAKGKRIRLQSTQLYFLTLKYHGYDKKRPR